MTVPSDLKHGLSPSAYLNPLSTHLDRAFMYATLYGVSSIISRDATRPISDVLNASMSMPGTSGASLTSPTPENHSIAICTWFPSPASSSTGFIITGAV